MSQHKAAVRCGSVPVRLCDVLFFLVAGPAKGAEAAPAAMVTVVTIRAGESVGLRAVLVAGKRQAEGGRDNDHQFPVFQHVILPYIIKRTSLAA